MSVSPRYYPSTEEKFDGRPHVYNEVDIDELLASLLEVHGADYANELLLKDAVFRAEEAERKARAKEAAAKE